MRTATSLAMMVLVWTARCVADSGYWRRSHRARRRGGIPKLTMAAKAASGGEIQRVLGARYDASVGKNATQGVSPCRFYLGAPDNLALRQLGDAFLKAKYFIHRANQAQVRPRHFAERL